MGARPYRHLSLYDPAPGCLIEIGSERGEGSTAWLSRYAHDHGLAFRTADINYEAYATARELVGASATHGAGTAMVATIAEPISVAYMDGFDWIPQGDEQSAWILDQKACYRSLGFDMTNAISQATHLEEAQAIADKLAERCVVICDDTWLEDDAWTGKGGRAVPFLLDRGLRVVDDAGREDCSLGYVVMRR